MSEIPTTIGVPRETAEGERRVALVPDLLQRHGAARVIHVVEGGVPKWERLGHPLERSEQPATASA